MKNLVLIQVSCNNICDQRGINFETASYVTFPSRTLFSGMVDSVTLPVDVI